MNPVIDDEAAFAEQVREVVSLNSTAVDLAQQGIRVVSCDEKTGMQALERLGSWQMSAEHPERQESWYRRHGVLCLIANLDLASGEVVSPTLGDTRGNDDFSPSTASPVHTAPSP